MEYNLKTQIIGSPDLSNNKRIALSNEYDIPEKSLLEKKGRLFVSLSISVETEDFDLKSAATLFIEELRDEYYSLTDDTPLHSIEKALNKATKDLMTFKSKDSTITLNADSTGLKISYATAVVWNSVMYTSYIKNSAAYIIRGSGARNLNPNTNNDDLWTTSSIITGGDVVIIGTSTFNEEYGGNNISENLGNLSTSIINNPNKDLISALLVKVETTGDKKQGTKLNNLSSMILRNPISNQLIKVKGAFSDNAGLSDKFKLYQSKKIAPVSSINSVLSSSNQQVDISGKIKPKRITKIKSNNRKQKRAIVGLAVVLFTSYLLTKTVGLNQDTNIDKDIRSQIAQTENTNTDQIMGDQNVNLHESVLNLSQVNQGFIPVDMEFAGATKLVLLGNNSVYEYDTETKESKQIYSGFDRGEYLTCSKENPANIICYVYALNTLYVFEKNNPQKSDKYVLELPDVADVTNLNNNVYLTNNENIYRYALTDLTSLKLDPNLWLKEDTQIESNIKNANLESSNFYVLSENTVIKYTNGIKDENFSLELNQNLTNSLQFQLTPTNILVLNSPSQGADTIEVYDKRTGQFQKSIVLTDVNDSEDVTLFTISPNSRNIIYKKGNNLFTVQN